MSDTLPVTLNVDRMHGIEAAPSFETAGPFVVRLVSDDTPAHVHLHLDDALSTAASLDTNNHYVETVREVAVDVAEGDRPVKGTLEITTGYGANTERVAVTIIEPRRGTHYVDVDDGLNAPPDRSSPDDTADRLSASSVTLVVLTLLALGMALGTAATLGGTGVALGTAVVVCSVVAAVYLLVS